MGIIDLKTNLKSLRYGKDRPFGGSSNQPYVKRDIDVRDSEVGRTGGPDFLLRGGTLVPQRIGNDVSRMTQMFFDLKSPNGLLFTAKQNILSRTSVAVNGDGKALNSGLYLPTSTLLQSGGNAIGLHINKQGLDPFIQRPTYLSITKDSGFESRLKTWVNGKINTRSNNDLYEYQGGPGSILGIGKTKIKMYDEYRTGINSKNYTDYLKNLQSSSVISTSSILGGFIIQPKKGLRALSKLNPLNLIKSIPVTQTEEALKDVSLQYKIKNDQDFRTGVSTKYSELNGFKEVDEYFLYKNFTYEGTIIDNSSIYKGKGNILENNSRIKDNNTNTLNSKQIYDYTKTIKPAIQPDFRIKARNQKPGTRFNYILQNIEKRIGLNNPGNRRRENSYDYTDTTKGVLDKLTSSSLYTSTTVSTDGIYKDIIKFRIGIIDTANPTQQTFIHFRAFIDSMSDNYTSEWDSHKLMGRGENFYSYRGFDRTISLSWTVPAQSKEEMENMYKKLNYLASSLTPNYSSNGYMRGNLATLTVGDYIVDQPGIIKSMNLEIPNESPWNIQIIDEETDGKELPLIIKVSGFSFIPIHKFVPKIEENYFA